MKQSIEVGTNLQFSASSQVIHCCLYDITKINISNLEKSGKTCIIQKGEKTSNSIIKMPYQSGKTQQGSPNFFGLLYVP